MEQNKIKYSVRGTTVLLSLDERHYTGGLLCDLQKAFDCVNHDILLAKMKFYVITGEWA